MNIEELGFTKEELQNRVVSECCDRLMKTTLLDEDGDPWVRESAVATAMKKQIADRVDERVRAAVEHHLVPKVDQLIADMTLQATNQWGEQKGGSLTIKEYLVDYAQRFLDEPVDFQGKARQQNGGYSFKGTQTRLTHMIHQYLHYEIEKAIKEAVNLANGALAKSLKETCAIKLAEIQDKLMVKVATGR